MSSLDQVIYQYQDVFQTLGREEIQLTVRDLTQIHQKMVERFGGDNGIRDQGLFEPVATTPYQSVFGQDLFPTPFDKAAKYLFCFANYQIFLDGNKRTGLATALYYLTLNGYRPTLTNQEAYQLTLDIANHKVVDIQEIANILKEHTVQIYERTEEAEYDRAV